MMTQFSNMYGTKGIVWEYIVQSALDAVADEGHVALGIFPCGPCLFELPTAQPEVICIYSEHVDYLLDPCKANRYPFIDPTNNKKVHFKSLYSLAKDLAEYNEPFQKVPLGMISPYISEPLFEEEIFLPAKNKYTDIVKKHYFLNVAYRSLDSWKSEGQIASINYLLYRTEFIYSKTGVFVTNHLGYDISDMLDPYSASLDKQTVDNIYSNVASYSEINSSFKLLSRHIIDKKRDFVNYNKDVKELGKIIKNLYSLEL